MRNTLKVLLAAALLALSAGIAQGNGTQEICPGSPVPRDWVLIDIVVRAGRCTPGHLDKMLKIQDTRQLPVGSFLEICPDSALPKGWVVTGGERCAGCCGAAGRLSDRRIIKKIEVPQDADSHHH